LLAAITLTVLAAPSWAQERNIRRVLFVTPKLERTDEWKAAVKDYMATVKKSGWDQPYTAWASQTGPAQYAFVQYFAKWTDLDSFPSKGLEADLAPVMAKLQGTTLSLETWVDEMQPELTIPGAELPKLVRTGRMHIMPGKLEGMLALYKSELVPAFKKAGLTNFGIAVSRYGTPTNEIHTYLGLDGWAGLFDGSVGTQKVMSADAYKAYMAKANAMIENIDYTIWRFQPELSYLPEKK
jgi:hypothetical protein